MGVWIRSNKKIGVGEATSNPGKELNMSNKPYFGLKALGLAYQYLSTMYDSTTEEFFQGIEENVREELQALINEEVKRLHREHRNIYPREGKEGIKLSLATKKISC